MQKLSKQEIIYRLKNIDWLEFNEDDIVDSHTQFTVKCKKCGNIYQTTPTNLFTGKGCKKCYLIRHSSDEKNILGLLADKYKDTIDFSQSKYVNIKTKISCKCKYCGQALEITPSVYKQHDIKYPCPNCRKELTRLEYEQKVLDSINKKFPDKFDCSKVHVVNAKTKIILICKDCNTQFQITPDLLLNNKGCFIGCPNCAKQSRIEKKTKTTEEFIKQAKAIYGDTYDYSKSVYKGDRKPIKIICRKHGPFFTLPHYHLGKSGGTCPKCHCSSGELQVMNILEKLKIPYIYQFQIKSKEFSNDKKYVLMDFLLSKDSHIMFIEYNGKQHYEPVETFGGEGQFKKQLIRDQEVKEYCKKHNYPLLIIPYDCSNNDIEKLIKEFYGVHQSEANNN